MQQQNNNTYNHPPQGPMMPSRIQQRVMNGMSATYSVFPKWLSQYPVAIYIVALMVVSFMYSTYSTPWYYMLAGIISVVVFFIYSSSITQETLSLKMRREKAFEKRIFLIAIIPRVILTILLYFVFITNYGDTFGFEHGDAEFYHQQAEEFSNAINNGTFIDTWRRVSKAIDISDLGYASYIGFIYWLTGNSIIVIRLIKCLLSAWTVVLVYRIAKRNFGIQTARMAAIFCALWPNFWYYCAVHLKETEMVFLSVLFIEQADQMLKSRQFTAWKIVPVLLLAAAMFTFRTPLGIVALLALVFSVVMSSSKVVSWGKRIIVGLLAVALIGVVAGNQIEEQTKSLLDSVQSNDQKTNMEWRAKRDNGNAFAKYAGATVFAPMIFTLPFPTMVKPFDGQDVQQLLNGGNFCKNIISAFTIFAMVMLLMSGRWREHLMPLSFMLGYLVVLTMSSFAQSERFHQPVMPFEFMFAAYGLSIAVTKKKYKRWFTYWCALMFVACIAWNWFKIAGRGLT